MTAQTKPGAIWTRIASCSLVALTFLVVTTTCVSDGGPRRSAEATPASERQERVAPTLIESPRTDLQAVLYATSNTARVGDRLPIALRLRNAGTVPLRLLPAVEGSDVGKRRPFISIEVRGPDGRLIEKAPAHRFYTVDRLRAAEFVELPAAYEMDPLNRGIPYRFTQHLSGPPSSPSAGSGHYMVEQFRFEKPGTYTICWIYDAQAPANDTSWFGESADSFGYNEEQLLPLIANMPRGRYVSNTVSVTVTP